MKLKKVLVTGAAGFIGARVVEELGKRGSQVVSVDTLRYFKERTEHHGLSFGLQLDTDELSTLLSQTLEGKTPAALEGVQAVIHLGAITDTRENNWERLEKYNLNYSKRLWEFARAQGIPFVYASSAATYGDATQFDDSERVIQELRPLNPYGKSKHLFDLWALDEEKLGHAPAFWSGFKFFNVYGFGERHKEFMGSVVLHAFDQIKAQGQVTLFKSHKLGIADGEQKRDFVFVEDVVKILLLAAETPLVRGIYNLGTGQARTFLDLARAVFSALGRDSNIAFIDTPVSVRDRYQYFTEAKLDKLRAAFSKDLPFTSLEDGVRITVQRLMRE